jgi:hypothetical protein
MFHGFSPTTDGALEYRADIAYSPSAFRTYLARAADVETYSDTGSTLSHTNNAKMWKITLGPERFEGVALLKMSRMSMVLRLEGYARAEADAFLDRFLKHYQRGGG